MKEKTSLNQRFKEWLKKYVEIDEKAKMYFDLMDSMSYKEPGKKFTREEMNEK
ncbi:MAG: hypothetical protein P8M34_02145 [Saprospiraceae bacterium]|nr:hypothetical protein [Saprospiraceae bacterium]|tara:strand:+ start:183 stop:341 length:159 start_codon:yes stop_codon:yes gene_type:complete